MIKEYYKFIKSFVFNMSIKENLFLVDSNFKKQVGCK